MRALVAVSLLITVFFVSVPAQSDVDVAQVKTDIQNVISQQMDAFRVDDAEAAFSFAAAEIQAQFGTPERFLHMVRTAYQPVYRPRHVVFAHLAKDVSGNLHQHVVIEAEDGSLVMAVYPMTRDAAGNWRIAGCYIAPLNRKSA